MGRKGWVWCHTPDTLVISYIRCFLRIVIPQGTKCVGIQYLEYLNTKQRLPMPGGDILHKQISSGAIALFVFLSHGSANRACLACCCLPVYKGHPREALVSIPYIIWYVIICNINVSIFECLIPHSQGGSSGDFCQNIMSNNINADMFWQRHINCSRWIN